LSESQPEKSAEKNLLGRWLAGLPYAAAVFRLDGSLLLANDAFGQRLAGPASPGSHPDLPDLIGRQAFESAARQLTSAGLMPPTPVKISGQAGQAPEPATLSSWQDDEVQLLLQWTGHAAGAGSDMPAVGLLLVAGDGRITTLNPTLAELLGADEASWIGQPAEALLDLIAERSVEPALTRASLEQAMVAMGERPRFPLDLAGPPVRHVQALAFPSWTEQGGPKGWGLLLLDNSGTEPQANWWVEQLAALEHELRTSLASSKGQITALLANLERWPRSTVIESLQALDGAAVELVRRVDRSLALARLETGHLGLHPQTIEVAALVNGARERAAPALDHVRLALDLAADLPPVRVDPARIEEVFVSLLENAAAQTPDGATVRLGAQWEAPWVTVWVEDPGPVVLSERQPHLFDRAPAEPEARTARGQGLYIARRLVEAHGGRLWLDSPAPGQESGARFSLQLLSLPVESGQADPTEPMQAGLRQDRVLLVESDPGMAGQLQATLADAGYLVDQPADSLAAAEMAAFQPADLVLVDLTLPSGEALAQVRTIQRATRAPLVALTSPASADDLAALFEAGVDDYLTKPVQPADLLARLRANIQRSRSGGPDAPSRPRDSGLQIDYPRRRARANGRPIELTPTEFELLAQLDRHRGQVMTHAQLIEHLWPTGHGNRHRLFVHINRLRAKLEPDPSHPRHLHTRWGTGYFLTTEATPRNQVS
jgi:two-component system KDP operon response regulator KdpE